jgi:hypothetical protein
MRPQTLTGSLAASFIALSLLAATGCSSTSTPSPEASASQAITSEQQREAQLIPALVECLANHGVIPAKDLTNQSWYKSGHVTYNNEFSQWWENNNGLQVKIQDSYEQLESIVKAAATNGTWPSVCGSIPKVSAG